MLSADVTIIPGVFASMMVCRLQLRSAERADELHKRVVGGLNKVFWHLRSTLPEFSRAAMVGELVDSENLAVRGLRRATISHFSQDPNTAVDNPKLDRALEQFDRGLRALAKEPPTADELATARLARAGSDALARMTNLSVVRHLHQQLRQGALVEDEGASASAVLASEVRAEVEACLGAGPVLSLVGDEALLSAAVKRFRERTAPEP